MATKNSNARKSLAIALGIAGIAGLSMASAAQLTVSSDGVAAGSATIEACDNTGVTVGYTTSWDATSDEFVVDEVIVSGIDNTASPAGCGGLSMDVVVLNDDGTPVEQYNSDSAGDTVTVSLTSHTFTVGTPFPVTEADEVHVAIY